jgi:pyruvate/2-oxoglutarate dehydrogenase complex dihydrolipoamide dehydrogenase (E3) component
MYASVDVPVTVLEAMPEICPNLDAEISATLRTELKRRVWNFNLVPRWKRLEKPR